MSGSRAANWILILVPLAILVLSTAAIPGLVLPETPQSAQTITPTMRIYLPVIKGGVASPTNTPTLTRSPTPTRTATNTPTRTLTITLTPTKTGTPTATPTRTVTTTPTRTGTPTQTGTPTITITATPIKTATSTSTSTPTKTATATVTRIPTQTPINTATATTIPPCACYDDLYNCADFANHAEAQACYDYCVSRGYGDVHNLDADNDGEACEWLP